MKIFIILLISFFISCAALPPEKDFVTELWQLNLDEGVIERLDDEENVIQIALEELIPGEWVVLEAVDIADEWKYEKLLIKSCDKWR